MATDLLSSLPVDLLVTSVLPYLTPASLARLSATNRDWRGFLDSDECSSVWRAKAIEDFNFPATSTGRQTGWKQIISRLNGGESAYVWGQHDSGRLGIAANDNSLRPWIIQRGLSVPARIEMPLPPIKLAAAGWSFHALFNSGQTMHWGTFDASTGFPRPGAPLHQPWTTLHQPTIHPCSVQIGEIVQMEAGRRHVLLRTRDNGAEGGSDVFEMRSLGRTARVRDADYRWGRGQSTGSSDGADGARRIVSIEAAWEHSLVLLSSGAAFIWWETSINRIAYAAAGAGEGQLPDPTTQGVVFDLLVGSVQLPPLPSANSENERIAQLASGDNCVLALSKPSSRLYYLDVSPVPDPLRPLAPHRGTDPDDSPVRGRESRARLEAAFTSGRRAWQRMERFDDMQKVAELPFFAERGWKLDGAMRITHIAAHFKSFSAYSVPANDDFKRSIVLQGNDEWTPESEPVVLPELQGRGVIQIAQGDYHQLALTSSGQLLAWGAYSAGALGLGHPQLSNTPLSAPSESPASTSEEQQGRRHPNDNSFRFPGFARPRPAARIPDPPERLEHPMMVRFPGDPEPPTVSVLDDHGPGAGSAEVSSSATSNKGKFVFGITASGWHSGALAIDLSASDRLGSASKSVSAEGPHIRLHTPRPASDYNRQGGGGEWNAGAQQEMPAGNPPPGTEPEGGLFRGAFRIGFAGRGGRVMPQPGLRGPDR